MSIKYLFFLINYYIGYPMFKKPKKNNLFRVMRYILAFILSLIFLAIICAFLLIITFMASLAIALIVNMIMEVEVERLTIIITIVLGLIGGIGTILIALINNNKDFKIEKRKVYIQTIRSLRDLLPNLKDGKSLNDFTIEENLIMYASNRVINLLGQIKRQSEKLNTETQIRAIIYKLFFIIDCMRNEIKFRGEFISDDTNYYLRVLYDGLTKDKNSEKKETNCEFKNET